MSSTFNLMVAWSKPKQSRTAISTSPCISPVRFFFRSIGLEDHDSSGIHVGCFELFAKEGIRSVADLKGRTVGIQALETSQHIFLSAMATLVGLNPVKDIEWVTSASVKPIELFC